MNDHSHEVMPIGMLMARELSDAEMDRISAAVAGDNHLSEALTYWGDYDTLPR